MADTCKRVCVDQVMSLTGGGDGDVDVASQPTMNFPIADEAELDAIWEVYEDLLPTRQLDETDDYLDFFASMNVSAFTRLMASAGANDSAGLRSRHFATAGGGGADTFKMVVDVMMLYVTPLIVVIGVVGNALSLIVFSLSYLQRLSSSLYLSMLSVADIVFLLALLVVWLERVDVSLFTRDGWCQAVLYVSRVSGFLAAWYVVVFTAERYVIVHHPLRKDEFCTKRRARIVVSSVVVVALVLYTPTTWTHDVIRFGKVALCTPLPRHQYVNSVMATVHTLLSCLVPSLLIVVFNGRIIHKIRLYQATAFELPPPLPNRAAAAASVRCRRSYVQASVSASGSMHIKFMSKALPLPSGNPSAGEQTATTQPVHHLHRLRQARLRSSACAMQYHADVDDIQQQYQPAARLARGQAQFRTARMLLVLSSLTVLLNLPTHVFQVQAVIYDLIGSVKAARGKFTWQELFQLVHFLNYAVNFFVYSCCGRQFRAGLVRLCARLQLRLRRCCTAARCTTFCRCHCPSRSDCRHCRCIWHCVNNNAASDHPVDDLVDV